MNVVVTGAYGFIGQNLTAYLRNKGITVLPIGSQSSPEEWYRGLEIADIVYHLASTNRSTVDGFELGNVGPVQKLCRVLREVNRKPLIVMTSSTHVKDNTPYGISKLHAEETLRGYAAESGTPVRIHWLTNVFGKGGRPKSNGVVASFCYDVSHNFPIIVSDQNRDITLIYVKDVVVSLVYPYIEIPSTTITLGTLADYIRGFRRGVIGNSKFGSQLYDTYLHYARS